MSILLEIIMTATSNQSSFFNLHVNGVGYVNRVRWVEPSRNAGRRAEPFLACSIGALRGSSDQPDYTYFDLKVSGQEAIDMVDRLEEDVEAGRKVFIAFRIGDIYAHPYERDVKDRNGRKTGQKEMAALIKGRLLLINSITIDGERVFTREDEPADSNDASQAAPQGKAGDASPESAPTAGADAPESQLQSEEANPQRNDRLTRAAPRGAGPIARQSTSRVNERSTAYQGGYAAGRTVRQGYDAAARAAA